MWIPLQTTLLDIFFLDWNFYFGIDCGVLESFLKSFGRITTKKRKRKQN